MSKNKKRTIMVHSAENTYRVIKEKKANNEEVSEFIKTKLSATMNKEIQESDMNKELIEMGIKLQF